MAETAQICFMFNSAKKKKADTLNICLVDGMEIIGGGMLALYISARDKVYVVCGIRHLVTLDVSTANFGEFR